MSDRSLLLREYLNALRQDDSFLASLRSAGLGSHVGADRLVAENMVEDWVDGIESAGRSISPGLRSQVVRFVEGKMPGLVVLFRGNMDAARLTMINLLDARFRELV